MRGVWTRLAGVCGILVCISVVVHGDLCFRKYIAKKDLCKGLMRREYDDARQCCARRNAMGYALKRERKGKRYYECEPCSSLGKPEVSQALPTEVWGSWSEWTPCSSSCGAGFRHRKRHCLLGSCRGSPEQVQPCMDRQFCAINGGWSLWRPWEHCSQTCGGGTKKRQRRCNSPAPRFGGKPCEGNDTDIVECNNQKCPINGVWSTWSSFSSCSRTCGWGTMTRHRECNNPAPQFGGKRCHGRDTQRQKCNQKHCPVDGGWTLWETWSSCSVSCGVGQVTRVRACIAPRPRHGGKDCEGEKVEMRTCQGPRECPIHGGWTQWTSYGPCTAVECSGKKGYQLRTRSCTNPRPQNGGSYCRGNLMDRRVCEGKKTDCPVPGRWCPWQSWSACSKTCGDDAYQIRFRNCSCPEPANGGNECLGSNFDTKDCEGVDACSTVDEKEDKAKSKGCFGSGSGQNASQSDGSDVDCDQVDEDDDDVEGSSSGHGAQEKH